MKQAPKRGKRIKQEAAVKAGEYFGKAAGGNGGTNGNLSHKKFYQSMLRNGTLVEVTNMTTKAQERAALERIKKIVSGLGSDSYIAMAFEGCFEIAEENIENDFGCSMAQRVQSAEHRANGLAEDLNCIKQQLTEYQEERVRLLNEIESLKKRVLSEDDIADCKDLIMETISELDNEVREAAERIVKNADKPASVEFGQAVKDHRAAQSKLDYYMNLKIRLGNEQKAGA